MRQFAAHRRPVAWQARRTTTQPTTVAASVDNDEEALEKAFKHQEGRFGVIELGDENLPYVANRRLLRPKDGAGERALQDAFAAVERRPEVWDVLLDGANTDERHRGADEAAFRLTYPFSPALVSTLRSLASVMQRERTALKVMQQMLVERRDTLTTADLIPVGDAYQHIVEGTSALDPQAAALFRSASKLYAEKLRPLILRRLDLDEQQVSGADVPTRFVAADRLAKTLLLSAVAPNVPALKALTGSRLASLNHGSIVSMLPGGEAAQVLSTVRNWAQDVPEIHLEGDERNPTIRVQLADVDYESIVERAKGEDTEGRRRELLKALVAESLDLDTGRTELQGVHRHSIVWRGSRREVEVVFGNVRDVSWLPDDHFRASPGLWRIVIDHPFDEPGHSTSEDVERLELFSARAFNERTIVWLPRFLSDERLRNLRRLVILTWLLDGSGERWQSHADHLNETDRALAKSILESQRSALRRELETAIQQAYGAATPTSGTLVDDPSHTRVLHSLTHLLEPAHPVGATLGLAFEHLVGQAYEATYPGHPRFEPGDTEIRVKDLKAVAAHIDRAMAERDHRVELQGDVAAVRRVVTPLGVGTAAEMHYILTDDRFVPWGTEIERALGRRAQAGVEPEAPVTVRELREWIAAVQPSPGLRAEVADLVVIAWAALRQRVWWAHGVAIPVPDPGSLQPTMELRTQQLPSAAEWAGAVDAAGGLLGVVGSAYLTPTAVAELAGQVKAKAGPLAGSAAGLPAAIEQAATRLGMPPAEFQRLVTARESLDLAQRLRQLDGLALVQALAQTPLAGRAAPAGRSLTSADEVTRRLGGFAWGRLDPLLAAESGEGECADRAAGILHALRDALRADELTQPIGRALQTAEDAAFAWLSDCGGPPGPPAPPGPAPAPDARPRGRGVRAAHGSDEQVLREVTTFLADHRDQAVEVTWRVIP